MTVNNRFGVIGSPVAHSLSPKIHAGFAAQFDLSIDYQKYLVEPEELADFVKHFFNEGGKGFNVTLPHKQAVMKLMDELSEDARLSGSVNTVSVNQQGKLVGNTTDGQGLLLDLERLNYKVSNKKLLVVGAGGACKSILVALLKAGANVQLLNRTQSKVEQFVEDFSQLGDISLYNEAEHQPFDGVISSVSQFNETLFFPIRNSINKATFFFSYKTTIVFKLVETWCAFEHRVLL